MKQVDLYLIHWPLAIENGDFERTWRGFERAKREELTKFI
jgi:diketogulonate reductase-like aldo/keto reductase